MSSYTSMFFQKGMSPKMESIIFFHDGILALLFLISIIVLGGIFSLLICTSSTTKFLEESKLELLWSIIPAFFLILVALPSLIVLFKESPSSKVYKTMKILGLQWYWNYEYSDDPLIGDMNYDSYMITDENLVLGDVRKLEVDLPLFLYVNKWVRFLVSSLDVIHSFSVPSLGIKVDGMPGRMNQSFAYPSLVGKFYGQCSEICGANHSFMPMGVEVMNISSNMAEKCSKI